MHIVLRKPQMHQGVIMPAGAVIDTDANQAIFFIGMGDAGLASPGMKVTAIPPPMVRENVSIGSDALATVVAAVRLADRKVDVNDPMKGMYDRSGEIVDSTKPGVAGEKPEFDSTAAAQAAVPSNINAQTQAQALRDAEALRRVDADKGVAMFENAETAKAETEALLKNPGAFAGETRHPSDITAAEEARKLQDPNHPNNLSKVLSATADVDPVKAEEIRRQAEEKRIADQKARDDAVRAGKTANTPAGVRPAATPPTTPAVKK